MFQVEGSSSHPVFFHQGFFTHGRVSKRGTLKFTDHQGELIISSRSILDPHTHTQRAFMKKPNGMIIHTRKTRRLDPPW